MNLRLCCLPWIALGGGCRCMMPWTKRLLSKERSAKSITDAGSALRQWAMFSKCHTRQCEVAHLKYRPRSIQGPHILRLMGEGEQTCNYGRRCPLAYQVKSNLLGPIAPDGAGTAVRPSPPNAPSQSRFTLEFHLAIMGKHEGIP